MPGEFPGIAKTDLFARLAAGHAAGISVVTPNRRLAQVLKSEFDSFQSGKDLTVWDDADILPLAAFVERRYEDSLYSEDAADLPRLLAPAQERALWESVLAASGLLATAEAAAGCMEAWRLAHAWRIAGAAFSSPGKFPGNEDTQAFAAWARGFAKRCKDDSFVDAAVLPEVIPKRASNSRKLLVAYGFDILPPQTRDFLKGLETEFAFCGPETRKAGTVRTSHPSSRHELEAAARWARARLEAGAKRIGVVVPGLEGRRREVARVFSRVMRPGAVLPGAAGGPMPFNVSLGEPLSSYPVVRAGLRLLEMPFHEVDFEAASKIVRSPFIAGAESEFAARARLDARLRRRLPARLTLPKLIAQIEGCPVLRFSLEKIFSLQKKENQAPHDWARHFTDLLQAAGFPGERAPDSDEFQARAKFNQILGEFSRLSLVCKAIPFREAMRQLRRLCAETLFQPESADAPVQVMGILESAGLEFDHLWVSGLTDEAWPLRARPDPFLPVALQKKAGIPEAAAETSLALDRRLTRGWLGAAEEVVFSWPQKDADRDLAPSVLISGVVQGAVELPAAASFRETIFDAGKIETIADGKAPPPASPAIRGGTRVLADQAACPFRAFARHRLGASALEAPAEGPDAMRRGQLLHALMAGIWSELKSKQGLEGDLSEVISRAAEKSVKELELEGRFAALEKARLAKLAREWLEVEKARAAFDVVAIEESRPIEIGGLRFDGRIDRMDRLADGSHALIDYKTGRATPNDWLGERPEEPQLPLYAVSAEEGVSAVAFAKLKRGEMKFSGFSSEKDLIPGVKPAQSWPGLVAGWRKELEALARGFAAGDARVDPKKGLATCRNCDLQPLCRVHERLDALAEADGEVG